MYMIPLVIKNDSFRCVYIMDHVKAESWTIGNKFPLDSCLLSDKRFDEEMN